MVIHISTGTSRYILPTILSLNEDNYITPGTVTLYDCIVHHLYGIGYFQTTKKVPKDDFESFEVYSSLCHINQ